MVSVGRVSRLGCEYCDGQGRCARKRPDHRGLCGSGSLWRQILPHGQALVSRRPPPRCCKDTINTRRGMSSIRWQVGHGGDRRSAARVPGRRGQRQLPHLQARHPPLLSPWRKQGEQGVMHITKGRRCPRPSVQTNLTCHAATWTRCRGL